MRNNEYDSSYNLNGWDEDAEYTDLNDNGVYEEYDEYDDHDDYDLDEELSSEHNFRIAMSVFDLISMLVGLVVILVLTALLFGCSTGCSATFPSRFPLLQRRFNRRYICAFHGLNSPSRYPTARHVHCAKGASKRFWGRAIPRRR